VGLRHVNEVNNSFCVRSSQPVSPGLRRCGGQPSRTSGLLADPGSTPAGFHAAPQARRVAPQAQRAAPWPDQPEAGLSCESPSGRLRPQRRHGRTTPANTRLSARLRPRTGASRACGPPGRPGKGEAASGSPPATWSTGGSGAIIERCAQCRSTTPAPSSRSRPLDGVRATAASVTPPASQKRRATTRAHRSRRVRSASNSAGGPPISPSPNPRCAATASTSRRQVLTTRTQSGKYSARGSGVAAVVPPE
jgi:hypothetical protein